MAAATAVFGTAELSEMILLHLPMRDLLLIQRVNKDIRAVISGSKILQRKLFFRPAEGGPVTFFINQEIDVDWASPPGRQYSIHDFKNEVYTLPATAEEASEWPWMWHNSEIAPGVPVKVEKNPVVTWVMAKVVTAMQSGGFRTLLPPAALSDSSASWRRMRMTRPFAACLLVIGFQSRRRREEVISMPLFAEDTLGDIVDRIYSEPHISALRKRIKPFINRGTFDKMFYRHWDGQGTSGVILWERPSWVEGRDRLRILDLQHC